MLHSYLNKIRGFLEANEKRKKFIPVFESFETFFYVPSKVTFRGSHIRDAVDMKRTMTAVIIALLPALLFGMWNTGDLYHKSIGIQSDIIDSFVFGFIKILPIIIVSYIAGLGVEFIFVYLRGHEISEGYLVSGLLIPMIMPVNIPLWMVAVSSAFAVLIVKEAFGGTGMNIVNPALFARAFLFFAYPAEMSGDKVWVPLPEDGAALADGYSGATILAQKAANIPDASVGFLDNNVSVADMFIGNIPGSIGETSFLAILIGAAILIFTGVGSLRIMASMFIGGMAMALTFNLTGSESNVLMSTSPLEHIMLGGFAFGAVFMATDPVTAAQTPLGKIIYGFLAGAIAILIRCLNPAFPEGVMLAILLMNVFAPTIDYFVIESHIKKRMKRATKAVKK